MPIDLDPLPTCLLRFTINTHPNEEHISGHIRLQETGSSELPQRHIDLKLILSGGMMYAVTMILIVTFVALLASRLEVASWLCYL